MRAISHFILKKLHLIQFFAGGGGGGGGSSDYTKPSLTTPELNSVFPCRKKMVGTKVHALPRYTHSFPFPYSAKYVRDYSYVKRE